MVKLQHIVAAVLLWLGLAVPAWAGPPIPPLTGRVVDLAHVLDQRTVEALTKQLADHEAATTNQIVVVTLPALQDYTIEQWGYALLNGWGIGQRGKNNGLVLVVAPNDRRLRIEVGYGLEYALSDKAAGLIVEDEIIPRFKGGDLKGGVTAGVDAILQTINGTYKPPAIESSGGSSRISESSGGNFVPFVIFPLIFIIIVLMKVFQSDTASRRRQYYDTPGYGSTTTRRDRDGWGSRSSGFSSGRSSGGGFSGGGGRSGGGGASGRW